MKVTATSKIIFEEFILAPSTVGGLNRYLLGIRGLCPVIMKGGGTSLVSDDLSMFFIKSQRLKSGFEL